MTKRNLFIIVLFLLIAIIFSAITQCSSALSNKRLCYDPDCSEPVSLARTLLRYGPNEPGLLPFDINVQVTVYSKEAGSRNDLWGVEIKGKRGYVPKQLLKEYKILRDKLTYEVPINQLSNNKTVSNKKLQPKKENDKSKFVKKGVEASSAQINSLDSKPIEELLQNVTGLTSSYNITDETVLPLDHNESSFVSEVIQTTEVPSRKDTVDTNSRVSSDIKKLESNIFTKDKKLLEEVSNDQVEIEEQSISHEIDINKEFVKSSEQILSSSEITGVDIPPLDVHESLQNNFDNKLEQITEDTVNNASIIVKDTQSLDELSAINVTKTTILNHTADELNTNISVSNVENNTDTVTFTKPIIINRTAEELNTNISDSNVESNTDTVTFTEPIIINRTAKELNTNISDSNVENSSDIELNEKTNAESTESTHEFDTKDLQSVENATQSEEKEPELKKESETLKVKQDEKEHIPPLLEKLNMKDATEVKFHTDNITEIINEEILDTNLKNTSSGLTLPNNFENTEAETILDVITISPTSNNTELSFEEKSNVSTVTDDGDSNEELHKDAVQNMQSETQLYNTTEIPIVTNETTTADSVLKDLNVNASGDSHSAEVPSSTSDESHLSPTEETNLLSKQLLYPNENNMVSENIKSINEFRNRNLLNAETVEQFLPESVVKHETDHLMDEVIPEDDTSAVDKVLYDNSNIEDTMSVKETSKNILHEVQVASPDVCTADDADCSPEDTIRNSFEYNEETSESDDNALMTEIKIENNYWLTLMYLSVTAATTLIFSLGYYYIENMRRDGQLIAKINKLEKDLLISTKECTILNENLKLVKDKLTIIEDESFGSNEMVLSLKADLEASQNVKSELEEQVATLEKELELATEAGLELERMLREVLSSNNEVNPLAQSIEDLQERLNTQHAANESLTSALSLKTQENETLSADLASVTRKYEELEVELTRVTENLKLEQNSKNSIEQTLNDKVQQLEMQIKEISTEKVNLQKELKSKEVETKDLAEVINRLNSNNLDLDKLYDVSHVKAEATVLREEKNELKIRLAEIEGAHSLLEEHMKIIKDEVATLSEQCKVAEKEKKDAETRLEVLSNFFEEKEAQRQKEEAIWLQQQGEGLSTEDRITMQSELQNYKQQIEMLKREILDQQREYKNQISVLETKAHEQWVIARQVERRLEESKVEAGQLRNRLTLIEKNINDVDPEAKLHRLEANGETATSPPLFIGAESSGSPIMFSGSSSVPPPPPPSYLHSLFPPYLPPPLPNTSGVPPYEVSQRPPPLGGRLSSPPPMPLHPPASSRYDNASSPPPMSPHLLPPFNHRSPPPPFASDHIHPPPPPPGSILPPPLGTTHSWGEESLSPLRNSGFYLPQRERIRNHKGSLHSSGESLDKTHHNSKV